MSVFALLTMLLCIFTLKRPEIDCASGAVACAANTY
jgi:hypothetical protein